MEAFTPGRDITIDKFLIEVKKRSQHTLQIPFKTAGKGYKVYALCSLGYLYNFVFISRTQKIAEVPVKKGVRYTSIMIQYLMRRLPNGGTKHVIYLDNFFTTVSLLSTLKALGIGAAGIYKAGNGFPQPLNELRGALSQSKWGYKKLMRVQETEKIKQKQPNGKQKIVD